MQKSIKKKQLNTILIALTEVDYKNKNNLFVIRCEKLLKNMSEIAREQNNELDEIKKEFASTDEKGNFVYEKVTITDSKGNSKTENGALKYTFAKAKERDAKIKLFWEEEINVPCYLIKKEGNENLYKEIFKNYSLTAITTLAGIILDVPIDAEGFINEEFVMQMTQDNNYKQNGKAQKEEALVNE